MGEVIYWVEGSVHACFDLKFALQRGESVGEKGGSANFNFRLQTSSARSLTLLWILLLGLLRIMENYLCDAYLQEPSLITELLCMYNQVWSINATFWGYQSEIPILPSVWIHSQNQLPRWPWTPISVSQAQKTAVRSILNQQSQHKFVLIIIASMPSCFAIRRSIDSAYCSTAKAAVKRGREINGYNEKEDIARFQAFCRFVLTFLCISPRSFNLFYRKMWYEITILILGLGTFVS